jgi:hypothetical protein
MIAEVKENKMNIYIPRKSKCNAIQFTGDNREEVCKFLDLSKEEVKLWMTDSKEEWFLYIVRTDGTKPSLDLGRVNYGSWIVRNLNGSEYQILSSNRFRELYEVLG